MGASKRFWLESGMLERRLPLEIGGGRGSNAKQSLKFGGLCES